MKKFNAKGLKKSLMLGTLALAISVPAGVGAASAAPASNAITQDQLTQVASRFGIDLHSLLQQIMQGQYPAVSKPSTGGNSGSGQVTNPGKPSQPSKPSTGNNGNTGNTGSGSTGGNTSNTGGNTGGSGSEVSNSAFATQVVTLVNQERAKAGLKPLASTNATLTKMALDKAKDMYNNGYFDHNSPTYGSPFDMMKKYGINYRYAGENIAKGQRTPQEVMNAWMNSPGHRANILSANFTTIGVAYYNGVWVQEFIS
ncbi:CAP domain-containing protein [Cohnella sp.]|uniref:CAP domain-containing protein n=1 Tax=Cohnella sp. TaxID=1883426 RepID=UPI0035674875